MASIGCGNTNRLTDDDFTLGGVSYSVTRLAVDQNGELTIAFDPDPPDAFDNLVLVLDSDRFPLEDADDSVAEARSWSGTGLSWTFGTDVAVALELPEPVAACDGDEAPAGAFWTSCLTVADLTGGIYGYSSQIAGSLDDTTFHRDGAEHVIDRLFGRGPQDLDLGFTATPSSSASGWTLQVGSESFALSAATYNSHVRIYVWDVNSAVIDSGDVGNKITVSLRPPEPGAPTGLTAAGSSATQIDLSWTAPAYAGASAITGYKIEVSTDGSTWTDLAANTASTTTSYDHTGLSANDVRHYRVSAINTQGTGPASDSVRATARGDTTAPTVSSAAVTSAGNRLNLIFSEAMDQTFANEPALTAFRVTAGGFFVPLLEIGAGTSGTSRAVNLARTIKSGQTVRVSYTDPTAADDTKALQDAAGNDVATFADQTVTNNSTVAAVVPEKALFLTADPMGSNQIDLSWGPGYDGGSAVTSYKIEVSTDGTSFTDLVASTGNTDTTYSHTGLTGGTTRHYRVSAINTVGTGAVSDIAMATTNVAGAPGMPTGLTATAVTDKRIDLSWTAPAHVGDSAISGYRIEGSGSGTTWRNLVADTGDTATTYSHTGRQPNQTVYYRVSAINSQGTGLPSGVASATTPADTFPPTLTSSSVNVVGTQLGFNFNENVDPTTANVPPLSAFAVTADGEAVPLQQIRVGAPRRYVLDFSRTVKMGQAVQVTYTDPTAGDDTEAMQDLAGNDVATFTVDPTNNSTVAPVAPDAPSGLMASAVGRSRIDLSWTAPAYSGGTAVTGYRIEVSDDAGVTWADRVANTGSTDTVYSHTGLSAQDTRHYRVSAINSAGTGSASSVVNATTSLTDTAPGIPTGLSATAAGRSRIDLSWSAPSSDGGAAVTGYKIEVAPDGQTWSDLAADTGSTGTTYSHTGLSAGTTRHYRVSAINSVGTGNPSAVDSATTGTAEAPDPPAGLSATASGRTRIDLSWSAPSDDGGSAVTGYRIDVSSGGSGWRTLVANTGSTGTTYSHTGLSAGTMYHYRVSAINSAGAGRPSAAASATTERQSEPPPPLATVPGAATGLSATSAGQSRIDLSWIAPSNDGGAAVTGYRIEVSPDGQTWSDLVADTGSTGTTYSHTGLSPGTTRYYRVLAINSVGTGNPSNLANATTERESEPPRLPTLSVPPTEAVESDESAVFEVRLSKASSEVVTVDYETSDGDGGAKAGSDYTATAGTLELAPGSTAGRIRVPVLNDELYEVDSETFTLVLRRPVNATFGDGGSVLRVAGTIHDDDGGSPTADFEVDGAACEDDLCSARTGVPVKFVDTSTGKVLSRLWDFGDGTTSRFHTGSHSWPSAGFYEVTLAVSDGETTSTASRVFRVEASEPQGTCSGDAETLCLQDSRFAVNVEWWKANGDGGDGPVVPRGTNDSGLFTFFDRDNWEILIKVLDGCAVNGHMWVYGASATTVGYLVTVTDTVTGEVREYGNEPGMRADAITDATAFAGACASPPGNASTPDGSVLRTDEDGTIVQEAIRPATGSSEEEEAVCTETPTTLCLQGGRYAVSAEWSTPEDSGAAPTVRARTPDSGLFYFFTPGNWEMLVKVLDGCSYNDHHWVFAASATDVGFVLTVRDTQTGLVKQYRKEPGRPARAVADIGALPLGCEP